MSKESVLDPGKKTCLMSMIRGKILILFVGFVCVSVTGSIARSQQMSDESGLDAEEQDYRNATELERFARCFTKDWESRSGSFLQIAGSYMRQLPLGRKAALEKEFREFLFNNEADSDEALLQRWYNLGAETWDFDLVGVRIVMLDFYWFMNPDAPEFQTTRSTPTVRDGYIIIGLKPRHTKGEE